MEPEIIYSDSDIIVLNKPPGVSVHGGFSIKDKTVVDFLLRLFPEIKNVGDEPSLRPGIVHRLDKNTSGVMIAVHNQESFLILKNLFAKRLIEKTYWAIVCGVLKEKQGIISMPIGRLIKYPLKRGVGNKSRVRGEREAITHYRVLKEGKDYSLVELKPKTGRMHQLRVHMKTIGHAVACDTFYGGQKVCCPDGVNRQLLHARSISFSYPEGRKFFFEADAPEDFMVAEKLIF